LSPTRPDTIIFKPEPETRFTNPAQPDPGKFASNPTRPEVFLSKLFSFPGFQINNDNTVTAVFEEVQLKAVLARLHKKFNKYDKRADSQSTSV
jgi:hypothetical protein